MFYHGLGDHLNITEKVFKDKLFVLSRFNDPCKITWDLLASEKLKSDYDHYSQHEILPIKQICLAH